MNQENTPSATDPRSDPPTTATASTATTSASTTTADPPPPDITKDRLVVISGGVTFALHDVFYFLADSAPAWLTLVPVEETEAEKKNPSMPPRERHIRIMHDMRIGTVEELVEDYRNSLTRCFNALTMKQEDGSHAVIPAFGEASMRKQNEIIDRHIPKDGIAALFPVAHQVFEDREKKRNLLEGFEPSQDVFERNTLMCLVALYQDSKRDGRCLTPPTDNPKSVEELIVALRRLKKDHEDRRLVQLERAGKIDIPQVVEEKPG